MIAVKHKLKDIAHQQQLCGGTDRANGDILFEIQLLPYGDQHRDHNEYNREAKC
ncbi:hypothetical protein D3C77_349840 [compost metagenome]